MRQGVLILNTTPEAMTLGIFRSNKVSEENEDFIKDFNQTAVINLLKKIMISFEMENEQLFQQLHR